MVCTVARVMGHMRNAFGVFAEGRGEDFVCLAMPQIVSMPVEVGRTGRLHPCQLVEPKDQVEAHLLFDNLGVTVLSGHRFLGSFIGDHEGTLEYVKQKVQGWSPSNLKEATCSWWFQTVVMLLQHCATPSTRNFGVLCSAEAFLSKKRPYSFCLHARED